MRTKICGIRNLNDARIAVEAGASAVGFLVGVTHLAEDKISKNEAVDIIRTLPPLVSSVLVTHLTNPDEIIKTALELCVTTIQIHDYIEPNIARYIKNQLNGIKTIKAIPIVDRDSAIEMAQAFQESCDALLLDSLVPGRIGGTGQTHDWEISREIVEASDLPVFLAGGLNPENVAEAVSIVKPYGVDVNSGVEIDGFKDINLTRNFICRAQR